MTRSIILFLVAARDDSLYTVWQQQQQQQQQMSEREPSRATFMQQTKDARKIFSAHTHTHTPHRQTPFGRSVDQGLSSIIHLVSVEN